MTMIKLSDDPVWIQTTVLGLFGFVRDPHRRFTEQRQGGPKLRHGLQLLLAGLVLSSTLCLIIFEIGTDITHSLVAAREAIREPFIIRILSNLANCFYPTRAVLVLTIFLTKRTAWMKLCRAVKEFTRTLHQDHGCEVPVVQDPCPYALNPQPCGDPWHRLQISSLVMFLFCSALHLTFSYCEATMGMGQYQAETSNDTGHLIGEEEFDCYFTTVCITWTSDLAVWIMTADLSFLLSQQILLCAFVYALILLSVLNAVERDIMEESEVFRCGKPNTTEQFVCLKIRTKSWSATYISAKRLLCLFNSVFGHVILLSAIFDVLTALGLGVNIMKPLQKGETLTMGTTIYYVFACGLFVSYTIVLFVPFVLLQEKVCALLILMQPD